LLDEHLRGILSDAIWDHNAKPGADPIIFTRVGDPPDLPLGSLDPAILRWAEREGYMVVSCDRKTMVSHFQDHLAAGGHLPGLLLLPGRFSLPEAVEYLDLIAYASDPSEWYDCCKFIL
jgi:hypothetical protein